MYIMESLFHYTGKSNSDLSKFTPQQAWSCIIPHC